MNKQKSIFVAALVAILLAVIMVGAYLMKSPVYGVLALLFGAYGFVCSIANFSRWLGKETPLLPARTQQNEDWEPDEDFRSTYDQIRNEVQEGRL